MHNALQFNTAGWLIQRKQNAEIALKMLPEENAKTPGWKHIPFEKMSLAEKKITTFSDVITPIAFEKENFYIAKVEVRSDSLVVRRDLSISFEDVRIENFPEKNILPAQIGALTEQPLQNHYVARSIIEGKNGFAIFIKENITLDKPLIIDVVADGQDEVKAISWLIFLGRNSDCKILINWKSSLENNNCPLLSNGTIIVADDARLDLLETQALNHVSWMYSNVQSWLLGQACMHFTSNQVGATIVKQDNYVNLVSENSEATVTGLYKASAEQIFNFDTRQNHFADNSKSDLLYKGALREDGRAVWQGMVDVKPGTKGVDGFQTHRAILVSPKSKCDSLPGLEINTDEVRCSHAVAIGSLDVDQIFYLQARGIPPGEAAEMILNGFYEASLERIPTEEFRKKTREQFTLNTE